MLPNPTIIGLEASIQRLEDNIRAARASINLEVQRIQTNDNNRNLYREQLARSKQQHKDLVCESQFLGPLISMNGDEIRTVRRRIEGLKSSLRQVFRAKMAAETKIASIQNEIEKMNAERVTIQNTIESLQAIQAISGNFDYDAFEDIDINDMMEMEDMMVSGNMDESALDMDSDYDF